MTDNNQQWQPGDPPPPPSGGQDQPYAGAPGQQGGTPQQGGWQSQPPPQPQGDWQGQGAYQHNQQASGDERTWMILAHISAPVAFIVSAGWLSFVGPLLVWLFKKEDSPRVRQAAAGAFNFNLTFWLLYLLGWVVGIVTLTLGFLVVIPFWIVIFLIAAYAHIRGAILASRGETYTYPFQIRILS